MSLYVESFGISSEMIAGSDGLRLDASYYNRDVIEAIEALERSDMDVRRLGSLTERVFMPNRFARNYVDPEHGVPFLHGRHIVHFRPDDLKYLSRTTHKNMETLLVREGWILVTRSGTVGRVAVVTSQWDGWAATEDLLRVVLKPNTSFPVGFLLAFLGSPLGRVQLTKRPYGAVIDHLTESDIENVRVPFPTTKAQRTTVTKIAEDAMRGALERAAAVEQSQRAEDAVKALIPVPMQEEVPEEFANFVENMGKLLRTKKPNG